ncbi:hypothetical protein AMS68_007344 [Peltaster fructicola]|uniref:Dynamin N-terminal domain-containing protein n=1 Tax=Peltaster fructicola TaxID=286661 RepID=A0A6H0Y475_9PEZI|nr:hypothetical protein AMS68_007344 [Peltaster fructicola]
MESDPADPTFQRYDSNDARQEPLPRSVQYQAEFKSLEKACSESIASVRDLLFNNDLKGPTLDDLRREFSDRFAPPQEKSIKLAVFGDMASGKSSLINSLLGVGAIARSQDAGESCTFVVHRYRKRFAQQKARFAAKAHFLSIAEIEVIIRSLLDKYYIASGKLDKLDHETDQDGDIKLEDDEDSDENDQDCDENDQDCDENDQDSDEDIELENEEDRHEDIEDDNTDLRRMKNENREDIRDLLTVFRSLFCDHDCFSSDKNAEAHLDAYDPKDDEAAVAQLVEWSASLVAQHLRCEAYVYREADTCEEMTQILQPFTHRSNNNLPDPWPLVRSVEFGLSTSLLDQGFVFIDAPGLTDASRYRRQRALDIQREASYIIVVAQIGRAMSNENLRQQLDTARHSHGSAKTIVVLSYADKIDKNTEVEGTLAEQAAIEQSQEDLTRVGREILGLRRRLRTKPRPDRETRADINEEIDSLELERLAHKMAWTCRRLALRNRRVVRSLQELYAGMTNDEAKLCVFPVGNAAYRCWQEGFDDHHAPSVSLEATGIPALRSYLFTSQARSMLNELLQLYRTRIPQMLDILQLYSTQSFGSIEYDINASLDAQQTTLSAGNMQLLEHIEDAVKKHVLSQLQLKGSTWSRRAVAVCQSWLKNHNSSEQLMMLRHDGFKTWKWRRHGRPTMVNWNADILDIGKSLLRRVFGELVVAVRERMGHFIQTLQEPLSAMIRTSKGFGNNMQGPLKVFLATIERDIESISTKLDSTFDDHFFSPANNVLGRATLFWDDSYLVMSLKPVFQTARTLLGRKNVPIRRKLVEVEISKKLGGPWSNLHDCVRDDLNTIAAKAVSEAVLQMTRMITSIRTRFQAMDESSFFENSESKKEYDTFKAKLSEHVSKTKAALQNDDNWRLVEVCIRLQASNESVHDS